MGVDTSSVSASLDTHFSQTNSSSPSTKSAIGWLNPTNLNFTFYLYSTFNKTGSFNYYFMCKAYNGNGSIGSSIFNKFDVSYRKDNSVIKPTQSKGLMNHWYITYEGKNYNCGGYGLSHPDTQSITADDGTVFKLNANKKNYVYTKWYTQIITNAGDISSTGLPFYAYHKDSNNLYLYVSLTSLKAWDGTTTSVKGWLCLNDTWFNGQINTTGGGVVTVRGFNDSGSPYDKTGEKFNYGDKHLEEDVKNIKEYQEQQEDLSKYFDSEADYNNSEAYEKALMVEDSAYDKEYWDNLYSGSSMYSLKSHNSIIGLPLQFLPNADFRPGESAYGKQFLEDIIYDMNIACIKPGGPVLNPKWAKDAQFSDDVITGTLKKIGTLRAYWNELKTKGTGGIIHECLFSMFKGSSARFYSFQSDYTHYTHYVNTLCHLFITFLGIGKKEYINAIGDVKKYDYYTDDYREIEKDGGRGLKMQHGFDNAVYMYYSDEGSSINQNFTNTTMQSGLQNTLQEASNAVKEWGFLINAAGIEAGKGVLDLSGVANSVGGYSNTALGRLFSNAAEGTTAILAGNNISLPEIYADSDTTVEHTFKIKLASPYGDPESVFLYVLRPLARLLAFSLPRQFSSNSYGSPFIVQAYSKGQFNCQLGIVTNLSITRCGNGGESHTINHIPTELEVSITIADMYDKIFLSNEYFGNSALKSVAAAFVDHITGTDIASEMVQFLSTSTAARLLYNNVGLIDFTASLCGFNLNMPTNMDMWETMRIMMKNRTSEYAVWSENDGWMFPQWEKTLNDAYNDAVQNLQTPIVTTA